MGSITNEKFICRWDLKVAKATKYELKKGAIMLKNDTLFICHRLLYREELINSLYVLTLPRKNSLQVKRSPIVWPTFN